VHAAGEQLPGMKAEGDTTDSLCTSSNEIRGLVSMALLGLVCQWSTHSRINQGARYRLQTHNRAGRSHVDSPHS
jgi:hypothetical protein